MKKKSVTKKKPTPQEIEELEKIIRPEEELTFERKLSLQYSSSKQKKNKKKTGQYFVRFPKEFEELLNLQKKMDVTMTIKIPPKHKQEKVKVYLEF